MRHHTISLIALFSATVILLTPILTFAVIEPDLVELPSAEQATLQADKTEIVPQTGEVVAKGNVRFGFRDIRLFCDELSSNFKEDYLEAKGNVRVVQQDRELHGKRFCYRFGSKEGTIDEARAEIEGFEFTGEQILINGKNIIVKNATATACQETRPHFKIQSGEIEIKEGKTVTFRKSYLVLGRHRLFRLPKYTTSLQRSTGLYQGQGITPVVFANGRDGFFAGARYRYQFDPGPNHLSSSLDFGYSATRGIRGGPELELRQPDYTLQLRAKHHDTVDYHFNPNLLVDVKPELLAQSRVVTIVPKQLGAYAGVSYGRFTELPTKLTGTRRLFYLHLDTRTVRYRPRLYGRAFFLNSAYPGTGTSLTVYGAELGTHGKLTKSLVGEFAIVMQEVNGRSQFQFDEVLIARELRADFDYRVNRDWIVPFLIRYDLDRNTIRDKRIGLMRSYDCVAYGLSFDSARREFRFEGRYLLGGLYRQNRVRTPPHTHE